jgi:hypothetical protein
MVFVGSEGDRKVFRLRESTVRDFRTVLSDVGLSEAGTHKGTSSLNSSNGFQWEEFHHYRRTPTAIM